MESTRSVGRKGRPLWWSLTVGIGFALVVCLALFHARHWQQLAEFPESTDFYKFYRSGERLRHGLGMYWPSLARVSPGDPCFRGTNSEPKGPLAGTVQCLHPNLNPPFFAAVAWPLAGLGYAPAWMMWSVGSLLCGLLAVSIAMCDVFSRHRLVATVFGWAALLAYFPTYATLSYGQVTLFLMLLLVLGWRALRHGTEVSAGVWLGLAASLKPFVLLVLPALLVARLGRAAASCAITCLLAAALGLHLVGWEGHLAYLQSARDISWLAASWNGSVAGYFSRIFGGSENLPWLHAPAVGRALTAVVSVLLLVGSGVLLWRSSSRPRSLRVDLLFALLLPSMLLVSPLGWLYYFPFLLLGGLLVWRMSALLVHVPMLRGGLLALLLLTAVPRALEPAQDMSSAYFWFWAGALYHYALLALWALTTIVGWRVSRTGQGEHQRALPVVVNP